MAEEMVGWIKQSESTRSGLMHVEIGVYLCQFGWYGSFVQKKSFVIAKEVIFIKL